MGVPIFGSAKKMAMGSVIGEGSPFHGFPFPFFQCLVGHIIRVCAPFSRRFQNGDCQRARRADEVIDWTLVATVKESVIGTKRTMERLCRHWHWTLNVR
jgi:hypothetical protein